MEDVFKYPRVILLLLMLVLSCQGFTAQDSKIPGNYYVQSNEVFLAPNGMYASIDGNLIEIHTLCSDENGVFVPIEEIIAKDLEWCPFCGRWYDSEQGHSNCPGFPE